MILKNAHIWGFCRKILVLNTSSDAWAMFFPFNVQKTYDFNGKILNNCVIWGMLFIITISSLIYVVLFMLKNGFIHPHN